MFPLGLSTADLQLVFNIKETECETASRSDPQTCAFRPGLFVVRRLMTKRLQVPKNVKKKVTGKLADVHSWTL